MKNQRKFPVQQGKKPQLVAPVNALDEATAKTLYNNQKVVVEHLMEFSKKVISIKRDMRAQIEKEVNERLGDYVHEMKSALDGVIALRAIFIEKGFISQDEYNKEKEEMRKRKS